jgi:hypothetical protein
VTDREEISNKESVRMADNPDFERDLFLRYYGEYLDAKEQNHPLKIWLKAVHCRVELQKLTLLPYEAATEENVLRQILAGFVTNSQVAEIFVELQKDSSSYPSKRGN